MYDSPMIRTHFDLSHIVIFFKYYAAMSDTRVYGIFDGTALANLQQMIFGTQTVSAAAFSPTYAQVYAGGGADSYAYDTIATLQLTPQGCSDPLPFSPAITMEGSQCFATYNPTSASGNTSIGRAFGTSGILW